MANLHQLKAFANHWLTVVDQHSIHSPFFFDFYKNVIRSKESQDPFTEIEKIRTNLLSNQTELVMNDLGAGSQRLNGTKRKLADIARISGVAADNISIAKVGTPHCFFLCSEYRGWLVCL